MPRCLVLPVLVAVVLTPAVGVARAPGAPKNAPISKGKAAGEYLLDGIRIGDPIGPVLTRAPYDRPCDIDPVDGRTGWIAVYGGLPCNDRTFPEGTSVVFLTTPEGTEDEPSGTIEAVAWLRGTWFSTRSDFPLAPGVRLAMVRRHFGRPVRTLRIVRQSTELTAHVFAAGVSALTAGHDGRVIGFVLGRMPDDPANERWRAMAQVLDRFSPRAEGAGARDRCYPYARRGGRCLKRCVTWNDCAPHARPGEPVSLGWPLACHAGRCVPLPPHEVPGAGR